MEKEANIWGMRIYFLLRRELKEKENDENIWRRKIYFLWRGTKMENMKHVWFKMAGACVPHMVLHVLCLTCTSGGYFRAQKLVLSKIGTLGCFRVKIGGW